MQQQIPYDRMPANAGDIEMGTGHSTDANGLHIEHLNPIISPHLADLPLVSSPHADVSNPVDSFDSVVYIVVPVQQLVAFQAWLADILDTVSAFKGFANRYTHEVERTESHVQFMIICVFDSFQSFNNWFTSKVRQEKYQQLAKWGIKWSALNAYGGADDAEVVGSGKLHRMLDQSTAMKVPKPRPPPKWKLTIVLVLSICILVVPFVFSGQAHAMLEAGLPYGFVMFIYICQLVIMNVFALSRIVTDIPWVDKWLRMPRPEVEDMNPILAVLDQGLLIFAVKMAPPISPELTLWMDSMEGKITRLRKVEFELKEAISRLGELSGGHHTVDTPTHSGIAHITDTFSDYENKTGFAYQSKAQPKRISMAVRHFVKWECVHEFEAWSDEIEKEMKRWEGFLGLVKISPRKDGDPYINFFSFDTAEHLLAFSHSERRHELLLQLVPLLQATSQAKINEERTISDGFSELFVPTGGSAKRRPPPLWKTCVLTIVPLHLIVWQVGMALDTYFSPMNLPVYGPALIKLCINITINSYIGVPLMFALFGDWLHTPRPTNGISYLRFLDIGIYRTARYAMVFAYVFACVLAGALSA